MENWEIVRPVFFFYLSCDQTWAFIKILTIIREWYGKFSMIKKQGRVQDGKFSMIGRQGRVQDGKFSKIGRQGRVQDGKFPKIGRDGTRTIILIV